MAYEITDNLKEYFSNGENRLKAGIISSFAGIAGSLAVMVSSITYNPQLSPETESTLALIDSKRARIERLVGFYDEGMSWEDIIEQYDQEYSDGRTTLDFSIENVRAMKIRSAAMTSEVESLERRTDIQAHYENLEELDDMFVENGYTGIAFAALGWLFTALRARKRKEE